MTNYSVGKFTYLDNVYSAEASDLAIAPGQVPLSLGITHRSGVVSKFRFVSDSVVNGEVTAFNYVGSSDILPARLVLFND